MASETDLGMGVQARLDSISNIDGARITGVLEFFEKYWIDPWAHWARWYTILTIDQAPVSMPLSKDGDDFIDGFLERLGVPA